MLKLRWRDGTVLLQTMIICLLLAYVSISVTKWVLQRYMGVINTYNSSMAMGMVDGGTGKVLSGWIYGTPSETRGGVSMDDTDQTKVVSYETTMVTNGVYKASFSYNMTPQ